MLTRACVSVCLGVCVLVEESTVFPAPYPSSPTSVVMRWTSQTSCVCVICTSKSAYHDASSPDEAFLPHCPSGVLIGILILGGILHPLLLLLSSLGTSLVQVPQYLASRWLESLSLSPPGQLYSLRSNLLSVAPVPPPQNPSVNSVCGVLRLALQALPFYSPPFSSR